MRVENVACVAHGALFAIDPIEKYRLDAAEGLGEGYRQEWLAVETDRGSYHAFTYLAAESHLATDLKPYDWYAALVLAGARYHGFPPDYVAAIKQVRHEVDAEQERRLAMEALLGRIESERSPAPVD